MPAIRNDFVHKMLQYPGFFTGQHEKIIMRNPSMANKSINIDGEEMVVRGKNFTELDRLSVVVYLIDHECQVVPLGAYRMIPTH